MSLLPEDYKEIKIFLLLNYVVTSMCILILPFGYCVGDTDLNKPTSLTIIKMIQHIQLYITLDNDNPLFSYWLVPTILYVFIINLNLFIYLYLRLMSNSYRLCTLCSCLTTRLYHQPFVLFLKGKISTVKSLFKKYKKPIKHGYNVNISHSSITFAF